MSGRRLCVQRTPWVPQVYYPLLLFGKKHYTGLKYEAPGEPGKRDIKGLACVRKDICPFLRRSCQAVIDHLLAFQDSQALAAAQQAAETLLRRDLPLDQLVLSRQLGSDYATDSHAHLQVARLVEQRNPGAGPKAGDRVSFVFVETGNKKAAGYERAEDPGWVAGHPEVQVDVLLYFENQLRSQLGDLFTHKLPGDPFATPAITALVGGLTAAKAERELAFSLASARQSSLRGWLTKKS